MQIKEEPLAKYNVKRRKTMILLSMEECEFGEETFTSIKGKIGKILDTYLIEVYSLEKDGMKYYEFFYYNSACLRFFIKQPTNITEEEIICAFKEMLALLKNPVEKKKMADNSIKKLECEDDKEKCNLIRLGVDSYEKHIEKLILEAEGIKKSPRNWYEKYVRD
jgi:FtsZ-binding cell division protein ZapB